MAAAATRISADEVPRVTGGQHGGARWGSGGRVACTQSEEGLRQGEKRGVGSLSAPLVAGGTRGKRGMGGVRSVRGHVEDEGGLDMEHA
jgi:hypothetical protein